MAEEFRDDLRLMIVADLPGLRPDRYISISITSDVLHIGAGNDDLRVEGSDLRESAFTRHIRLPAGTDTGDIRADQTDPVTTQRRFWRLPGR